MPQLVADTDGRLQVLTLFEALCRRYPGRFQPGQLRLPFFRAAAHAAWTSTVFNQGVAWRIRVERRFPALSSMIFALLAVPLRSYVQPLIIMAAIPFGLVGAVWGHIVMGLDVSMISMFGLVALTGVVVNDSLVMVDFINRARSARTGLGRGLQAAIREAGSHRFRPILLTSLTTFFGLAPLIMERSMQAAFLVPMAVSLAFGVLFATFITLILVPVSYLILDDLQRTLGRMFGSGAQDVLPAGPEVAVDSGVATTARVAEA